MFTLKRSGRRTPVAAPQCGNPHSSLAGRLADQLPAVTPGAYGAGGPAASEPTAWAALALIATGRADKARGACRWLADQQAREGSVGVSRVQANPAWPTGLAVIAWTRWEVATGDDRFAENRRRAIGWALESRGRVLSRKADLGHDTTLVGWSWATKTHSWLEPTAIFVRALAEASRFDPSLATHPRAAEGARLITDRLLPTGGANYGNTRVLQNWLLPHVQPTGLAMWALAAAAAAGDGALDPRIDRSLDYLLAQLDEPLAAASLSYAVIGLAAHGLAPDTLRPALAEAASKPANTRSTYKLALLTMAACVAGS